MITPNKTVSLQDSALGMIGVILAHGPEPQDLVRLYHKTSSQFDGIDHFMLTLDVLFVIGRIDVDFNTRSITYAR